MKRLITALGAFLASEDGPTAAEYALMAGFVVVAIAAVVGRLGGVLSTSFSTVSSMIS